MCRPGGALLRSQPSSGLCVGAGVPVVSISSSKDAARIGTQGLISRDLRRLSQQGAQNTFRKHKPLKAFSKGRRLQQPVPCWGLCRPWGVPLACDYAEYQNPPTPKELTTLTVGLAAFRARSLARRYCLQPAGLLGKRQHPGSQRRSAHTLTAEGACCCWSPGR